MTGSAGSGRLGLGGMSRGALGCVARSRFAPAEELGRVQARVAHGKSESLRKSTLRYHDFQSTSLAIDRGRTLILPRYVLSRKHVLSRPHAQGN